MFAQRCARGSKLKYCVSTFWENLQRFKAKQMCTTETLFRNDKNFAETVKVDFSAVTTFETKIKLK